MSKKESSEKKPNPIQKLKPKVVPPTAPPEASEEINKEDDLARYSSIPEIQKIVQSTIGKRRLATIDKKDEMKLIRAWCAEMGKTLDHLDLRVTEARCAGGYGVIFVSEFRLVDPSTKRIPVQLQERLEELMGNDPRHYSEFMGCNLKQRTFTLTATNKGKSSYGDLVVLDYLKYWVRKFEILKHININYRQFKWAPIVFVAGSPGQVARLKREGLKPRQERQYPDEVKIALVKASYDLTHTDRVMTQLGLVVKELDKERLEDEQKEEQMFDELMSEVSQLLLDNSIAAKAKLKTPNRVFKFFDKNAVTIVKYIMVIFIVFMLVSLAIAFITNTPLFSYLNLPEPDGTEVIPGGDAEVVTEP